MSSTKRWNRSLLRGEGTGPGFDESPSVSVCVDSTGITLSHHLPAALWQRRPTGELDDELKAELRLVACYTLLNELPQPGVVEALDSLNEMVLFYRERPRALPQVGVVQRTAVVTGKTTRPEFTLEGED